MAERAAGPGVGSTGADLTTAPGRANPSSRSFAFRSWRLLGGHGWGHRVAPFLFDFVRFCNLRARGVPWALPAATRLSSVKNYGAWRAEQCFVCIERRGSCGRTVVFAVASSIVLPSSGAPEGGRGSWHMYALAVHGPNEFCGYFCGDLWISESFFHPNCRNVLWLVHGIYCLSCEFYGECPSHTRSLNCGKVGSRGEARSNHHA